MHQTVVLNVVGLTPGMLGGDAPFMTRRALAGKAVPIEPILPAVTCSVQATYLTGLMPAQHGIVGNGWYFRDESEVRFWRQSNRLVRGQKVWDVARAQDPSFTCANLFWWYNMYSSVDYAVTPRPMYPADGRKIPDVYTHPPELRDELRKKLGQFPLFHFWGPAADLRSSQWIADSARFVAERYAPTLTMVYLPHLDYVLQRDGPSTPAAARELRAVDRLVEELVGYYERRGASVLILSEYGITPVRRHVALNRVLREHGMIAIREELGRELLDAGASAAFAVADHQVAHVYVNEHRKLGEVQELLESAPGVEQVLDDDGKRACGLDHPRAGDLVAVAEPDAWFSYYYWLDDDRAPDFARTVDIHRKPGYDPAELFLDPTIRIPQLRLGRRLLRKKLGFRYLMDVIPLDASLVKGSHGRLHVKSEDGPLLITSNADLVPTETLHATEVRDVIMRCLSGDGRSH